MRSHPQRISYVDTGLPSEQIEEFVRFARGLDAHSDPEQLMRSLPAELSNLVVSNTTALILSKESALSGYVLDGEELAIGPVSLGESWQDEIRQMIKLDTVMIKVGASRCALLQINSPGAYWVN